MKVYVKRIMVLVVFILLIWLVHYNRELFDAKALGEQLDAMGGYAPFWFMGMYMLAVVFFLPGSLLSLLGGFLFGPLWGSVYNFIAANIGASIAFLLSRYMGGAWLESIQHRRVKSMIVGIERWGLQFVAICRIVPVIPFNATNYALGLTTINYAVYFINTAIFIIPGTVAYTYLGSLGKFAMEGEQAQLIKHSLIAISLMVVVTIVLPKLVARYRRINGKK